MKVKEKIENYNKINTLNFNLKFGIQNALLGYEQIEIVVPAKKAY
jgi:hypothetical protein